MTEQITKNFLQSLLKSIDQINHLSLFGSGETEAKLATQDWNSDTSRLVELEWLFYPGMLFGSLLKWWGDWRERYTRHEGVDIAFYRSVIAQLQNNSNFSSGICNYRNTGSLSDMDSNFNTGSCRDMGENFDSGSCRDTQSFNPNIIIPAVADGTILNICDDFLGKSVVIDHPSFNSTHLQSKIENSTVAVIYSHLCVEIQSIDNHLKNRLAKNHLNVGANVEKGQIIGTVADTSMRKSGIVPHLHISVAQISAEIPCCELNWNLFGNPACESVKFFDPMRI